MNFKRRYFPFVIIPFLILLVGCATYYQKNLLFNENFANGDIEEANKVLDKNKRAATKNNRLLYFLQKGVVLQMMDDYDASNHFFEQAYFFTEDYRKSYSLEAASLLVNPMVKPYVGEDHELVLMHYFMALNYLRLNQYDEALVECRRINNKLNLLNDKYENKKNRYRRDAFALNLMGIAYEAANDINNAFIAYRNSYEAYEEDYQRYFGIEPPLQLKKDLLRTAYLNGFTDELERFEQKLGMKYEHHEKEGAELIFFWHNGLGPVKSEWSLNFALEKGLGGTVVFKNDDYGFNFPFPLPTSDRRSGGLSKLKFVRVTFPKYQERRSYLQSGEIFSDGEKYPLEIGEDINKIAFKTLEDRMLRELSNSLLRVALKQVTEEQVRKENDNLGMLLSVVNAVSEKADTRNWQTLPYSISYARVPLKTGDNSIRLKTYSFDQEESEQQFDFTAKEGESIFHIFHSLESVR